MEVQSYLQDRIRQLSIDGIVPKLAAILIGDDPASQVYVRNKSRVFEKLQCASQTYKLPKDIDEVEILDLINKLDPAPIIKYGIFSIFSKIISSSFSSLTRQKISVFPPVLNQVDL
mgnify:CR=1 FL=1